MNLRKAKSRRWVEISGGSLATTGRRDRGVCISLGLRELGNRNDRIEGKFTQVKTTRGDFIEKDRFGVSLRFGVFSPGRLRPEGSTN